MVITFKFSKNKTPVALTNGSIRCVTGSTIAEVKAQVNSKSDQAFYKNITRYSEEFGKGDYFAIKTETGYVFAFVSSDRSFATIKFREYKNAKYQTISYKLVISAKNQDCYVVNTKNNEVVSTTSQVEEEIKEIKEITVSDTDTDALISKLLAANAALTAENASLKEEIAQKDVKIAQQAELISTVERKRAKAVRIMFKLRDTNKTLRAIESVKQHFIDRNKTEAALEELYLDVVNTTKEAA